MLSAGSREADKRESPLRGQLPWQAEKASVGGPSAHAVLGRLAARAGRATDEELEGLGKDGR